MGGRPRIDGIGSAPEIAFDPTPSTPAAVPARRGLGAGMAVADLVGVLGEPDIVTRGPAGREIWVWDGVSSAMLDVVDTGAAAPGLLAGAGIAIARAESVFTVVVRFDELQQVSSVSLLAGRG